jgi:dTDP-4-amino-4,6-dideoxygalactose transaminase
MTKFEIPVMRPLLPTADKIAPHIKKIDDNRWYTNFGPVNDEFEGKLAQHFGVKPTELTTFSNATAALVTVMRSLNVPRGSYCAVPSYTFVATVGGVYNADLMPFFVDVNEQTWAVEPENLMQIKERITSVVVVAPFGAPIDIKKWENFKKETGINVIIDAAAAFDTVSRFKEFYPSSEIPIIVSLHATKPFGVGEGGLIICKNEEFIFKTRKLSNFGFTSEGIIFRGTNAKMNEYNAAVGLAEMEGWQEKRKKLIELNQMYLTKLEEIGMKAWLSRGWATTTCNVILKKNNAEEVINHLNSKGIESRRWWKRGCHNFEPYKTFPKTPLFTTDKLVDSVVAVPFWIGLKEEQIDKVIKTLEEVV